MENDLPYQVGTIKLTWVDPRNYRFLESKMFNSVDEALSNIPPFAKPNNYLIFKLLNTDGTQYRWELLPYGKSNQYISGMKLQDNKLLYFGALALSILGAFYLIKLTINKNK